MACGNGSEGEDAAHRPAGLYDRQEGCNYDAL